MNSRKNEFYMSVKAILDKTQVRQDAKELQKLLNSTELDFNSEGFEKKVREIVGKMSKETMSVIGDGFNKALALLGKKPIDMTKLIEAPNERMWEEFGRVAGEFYAKGLSDAINEVLGNIDISKFTNEIKKEVS